jgi:hypothetical protein
MNDSDPMRALALARIADSEIQPHARANFSQYPSG